MSSNKNRKKSKKNNSPVVSPKILLSIAGVAAAVCIVGIIISAVGSKNASAGSNNRNTQTEASAENADAITSADDINITHYAAIDIKDYGTITVALDETAAPETVKNFVSLAESGFYDGLTFHRIIDGFMMQGGDPDGNGTGGSDKTIKGEFAENGFENNLSHTKGAISMARSADFNSASSQFFIVDEDSTFLDGSYAAFGYVTEGQEIVDKICKDAKPSDDNGTIKAEDQPVINSIKILTPDAVSAAESASESAETAEN